jgi:copper chaperone CopZ
MKNIIFISLLFFSTAIDAQVKKVSIQASGLTCSMCSNSIYKALKSIDFVEKVDANIKNSTFEITFKPNVNVDFDKLKNKVEDAGFFVSGFWATIHFDDLEIKNDMPVSAIGKNLIFVHIADQQLNGDKTIKFLDKGYVSAKEFKKNRALTTKESYKIDVAEETSVQNGIPKGSRVYHVTI